MQYGALADPAIDEQWRRAMDYVGTVPELNYLSQIVIMIYEDPTVVRWNFNALLYFAFLLADFLQQLPVFLLLLSIFKALSISDDEFEYIRIIATISFFVFN